MIEENNIFGQATEAERKKALAILRKDPLRYQIELLQQVHVGDELLGCLLYLSGLTATLKSDQIHMCLVGSSGKGKSHLSQKVLNLFPEHHYYNLVSLSPKALSYAAQEISLNEKIIYCDEAEAAKEAIPILRALTSCSSQGRSVEHWTVDDKRKSLRLAIKGKQVVWLSSVQPPKDEQLRRRFVIANPDESSEQDTTVSEMQKRKYGLGLEIHEKQEEFKIAQIITEELMEECSVVIPYSKFIDFEWISNRGNLPFFLTLIKVITKANIFNRLNNGGTYIATLFDFELAKILWNNIVSFQKNQVSEQALKLYQVIPNDASCALDKAQLAQILGWSTSKVYKKANELIESELISQKKGESRAWLYWKSPIKSDKFGIRVRWDEFTLEELKASLEESSYKICTLMEEIYTKITEDCTEQLEFYKRFERKQQI